MKHQGFLLFLVEVCTAIWKSKFLSNSLVVLKAERVFSLVYFLNVQSVPTWAFLHVNCLVVLKAERVFSLVHSKYHSLQITHQPFIIKDELCSCWKIYSVPFFCSDEMCMNYT